MTDIFQQYKNGLTVVFPWKQFEYLFLDSLQKVLKQNGWTDNVSLLNNSLMKFLTMLVFYQVRKVTFGIR
jgi:hypothetical protein